MTAGDRNPRARRATTGKRAVARRARRVVPPATGLFGLVAIVIGLGTGSAVALAVVSAVTQGGAITAGGLQATVGEMTWHQVTPGVTDSASGSLAESPADFESMPGDVIEIRVPVTTVLQGDNLVADMTVDCAAPSSSEATITAAFHVEDSLGHQVAPDTGDTPVGTPLTVHGLTGGDAGTTAQWTVVLRVEVLDDYQWATTPHPSGSSVGWSVGTTHVALNQVRPATTNPATTNPATANPTGGV